MGDHQARLEGLQSALFELGHQETLVIAKLIQNLIRWEGYNLKSNGLDCDLISNHFIIVYESNGA